ncbi:MAG: CARDB domain-containing protein, partial [Bacteroidota bacterium]
MFQNGSGGLYFNGPTNNNNYLAGLEVLDNEFVNQYAFGMYLVYHTGALIDGNRFEVGGTYNSYRGIHLFRNYGSPRITTNQMYLPFGYRGILLDEVYGSVADPVLVANNFVSVDGTSTSYGIYSEDGTYQNIFHNTVRVGSTSLGSRPFMVTSGNNKVVFNNILANYGGGLAFYTNTPSAIGSSDYNDLYTTGPNLGFWSGNQADLDTWRTNSGQDLNSLSTDPLFADPTNYVVREILLNAAALPTPQVLGDIEGELRDASPDIGADEWTPPNSDAFLVQFQQPEAPFPVGNQSVAVLLKNNGTDSLFTADIDWAFNGSVQSPFNWSGTLGSGDTTTVAIGSMAFVVNQDYALRAWVSNPNGGVDAVPDNDTTLVENLYVALGGNYTLGGLSPDFNTFGEAVTNLTLGGVVDSVIFDVRDGTYNEQLVFTPILGAGADKSVRFQSELGDSTAVTLTFDSPSSANYTIYLNGVDHLSFARMTLAATDANYGRIIHLDGASNRIRLENNRLLGVPATSTSTNRALIYSTSGFVNDSLQLYHNYLQNGSYGLYFRASTSHVSGTEVVGNTFENQYYRAMDMDEHNRPVINDNLIQTNSASTDYTGIYSNDSNLGAEVRRNRVLANAYGAGMRFFDMTGTIANQAWIANNYVEIGANQGNTVYGIFFSSGSYHQLHYNSVRVTSTGLNASALYFSGGSNKRLSNNIWSNYGGGLAFFTSSTGNVLSSDFNNFFTPGPNFLSWGGTLWPTLSDWQNAGNLTEVNSISVPPFFRAPNDYRTAQSALNGAANPLPEVLIDLEGEVRDSLQPDIGADEFDLPATDAGVSAVLIPDIPFPIGNQLIQAILRNHGSDTLRSVTINWTVNGTPQAPINWTGTLLGSDTLRLDLNSVNFALNQAYELRAWTSSPNGGADPIAVNDTAGVDNLYAGLTGTYTIGGVSPDFSDFSNAANVLNIGGVVGPVTFNVRDGVYEEQIWLREFPGSDSLRQVLFQSESGDSTAVTLRFALGSSNNYLVLHDGTQWVRWRQLGFESASSLYQRLMVFSNGAGHIDLEQNFLRGPATTSTTTLRALVYMPNSNLIENLRLRNNRFVGGSHGIYLLGNTNGGNYAGGIEVDGNSFTDHYYRAMYLGGLRTAKVRNNTFLSNSNYSNIRGFEIASSYFGLEMTGNRVSGQNTGIGIFLDDVYGTVDQTVLLANNFVQVGGTNTVQGIYVDRGNYQKIYHNSVNLTNTNSNSYAYFANSGSNRQVYNNIFANVGGGRTYYTNSTTGSLQSDHNDLYTTGPTLGFYGSTTYADLATWQSGANRDTNSVSIDPLFVSDTDLHVTNVLLDKLGLGVAEVPVDIDGEARDPARPDLGADEFFTATEDASLVSIDSPVMPFAADLQSVFVTVLNNGLDTLESLELYWEVNGVVQAPFNWTGNLLSGETADSVNLGNFTFELDTAYTIRAWTANPNGLPDLENFNDTTEVSNLYAALGGEYTLGGSNPNFISFNHAATSLANGGVIAPVTFNVRNGTYEEQVSFGAVLGADATNTITFQSEQGDSSAVLLRYGNTTNTTNYVLQLDGADYFRFRQLSLESTSSVYSRVIFLFNGASYNEWTGNIVTGPNLTSTGTNQALVYSTSTDDEYNVFRYNRFVEGSYGIYLIGTNTANTERGTVIEYNDFRGQYYMGIRFLYQDAPRVSYNTIVGNSVYCCSYYGVYTNSCQNDWTYLGNTLTDIDHGFGFYFTNTDGSPTARGLLANNFVSVGQGASRASYGIYLTASDYNDIYYNSVRVESSNGSSRAFFLAGNETRVKNNIFANFNQGHAYYKQSGNNLETDFNALYAPQATLAYWDGSNATDLSTWRSLSGGAANSRSSDPAFVSPTDLHVDDVDLNNTGIPLASVSVDYDGEARDPLTPDIGADEFTPITTNDAEVLAILSPQPTVPFAAGVQDVVVEIKNNGADTLLQVNIDWTANGLPQLPYSWTGFLEPGERDTVTLGSFNFNLGFSNNLLVVSSQPNGQADNNTSNDTIQVQDLYPALLGTYTIGGSFPDFPSFSAAATSLNNGGILGPVTFQVRNGTYNEQLILGSIRGSGPANPILFQAENGQSDFVRLEHQNSNVSNYVVRLDGTDYITLQNLTLRSLGVFARIISLNNGANNVSILNNQLIAAGDDNDELIYSQNDTDQNLLIQGNRFVDGGSGVFLFGQNTSQLESGTRILDNVFENQTRYGIYLYYHDAPLVLDNQITTNSTRSDYHGIFMRHCDRDFRVERNRIIGGRGYGIQANRCDANLNERARIANNFIQVGGTNVAYGIYVFSGQFINFYHNSVHLTNTDPNSRVFYNSSGANKNVLNNVFANSGGGLAYYAATSLASSNFNDLYTTGPSLGYWLGTTVSDLSAWRALSGRDFNSVSANPLFYSDTDLHALQVALDSAATSVSGLTIDIDGEARDATFPDIGADEFDFLEDDLGIIAFLDPQEACDLGNGERVKVVVQNYGGLSQSGFDLAYRIGTAAPVVENAGSLLVQPGDTAHYIFATPADLSAFQVYQLEAYTLLTGDLNPATDSFSTSLQNYQTPAVVSNMLPADGALDIDPPVNFSWLPAAGALRYDLYLWEDGQPEPTVPLGQDLTQITFAYSSNSFIFGATYNWKIVAKNDFCETEGPTQSFTLRELPDLVVNNVQTIASPFSGQTIEVTWEVENQAIGSTGMTQWFDYLYLSADNVYQPNVDTYLGGFANLTALNSMERYSQMQLVTLPQGIQGDFYLFVVTDRTNQLIEGFEDNNVGTPANLLINLTPPADLVVSSIIAPNNAFSGSDIDVTWTVTNQGLGDIVSGTHRDYIFVSQESSYDPATAILLASEPESSALVAGASYTDTRSVTLPASVFGDYFIHVYTDFQNRVYEYVFEDNNDETSDTLNVILTPPPDLQVSNISVPDSMDNRETITVQWVNVNLGATPATETFSDRIYISTHDSFDPDSVQLLRTISTSVDLNPGQFLNRSTTVNVPNERCDTQYFYVFTDYNNRVFEHTSEDNNISRSGAVIARTADVVVSQISLADTVQSGETITLQWTVTNQGLGDVVNFNRTDGIFLSTDPVPNPATDVSLGNLSYGGILEAGQGTNKQLDVTLPNGISGRYYFHLRTDTGDDIFEKDQEGNNSTTDSSTVQL